MSTAAEPPAENQSAAPEEGERGETEEAGLTPELYQRLRQEARAARGRSSRGRGRPPAPPPPPLLASEDSTLLTPPPPGPSATPPSGSDGPRPSHPRRLSWAAVAVLGLTMVFGGRLLSVPGLLGGALGALLLAGAGRYRGEPRWPAGVVFILGGVLVIQAGILLLAAQILEFAPAP